MITQPSTKTTSSDYVINQVRMDKDDFERAAIRRSKADQMKNHKQFRIIDALNHNCADLVKVTKDLLVVICKEKGSLTIFRRQRD